jgi:hypothetical protein
VVARTGADRHAGNRWILICAGGCRCYLPQRQAPGPMPAQRSNARLNAGPAWQPTGAAIRAMPALPARTSRCARCIRPQVRYRTGARPASLVNRAANADPDSPARAASRHGPRRPGVLADQSERRAELRAGQRAEPAAATWRQAG